MNDRKSRGIVEGQEGKTSNGKEESVSLKIGFKMSGDMERIMKFDGGRRGARAHICLRYKAVSYGQVPWKILL